ncbi:Glycosylphosphatidylinositol (GPI) anchor assembly protein [Monascus purpureus]|uniref:Glycosylphosphatidylinositol (GPI) anchor assembly protein n=1 Tax=Monascus purpureus TaxID=5098 RepID=A0A507QYQ7_MONPU|nr:Glycosylphosphatidylinositol (GPI) anchor assembly protein [Monascus purpureus]
MTSTPPSPPRPAHPASTQPSTQAPAPKPSAPPVNILPSQAAQIYSIAHPVILLSLFSVRFPKLVADPVDALLSDLPLLATLQVATFSGSESGSRDSGSAMGGEGDGEKSLKRSGLVLRAGKPALLSLILTFLLATPVLAVLLVLFGAPLTTHNAHTVLCAAHMAVLSSTALIYVYGVDGATWRGVWGIARPADTVWGAALGSCLGAWLGAIPIPLDWDRPWQAFPITIVTGAYIGYALGSFLGRSSLVYGKRIEFEPEELGVEKKLG